MGGEGEVGWGESGVCLRGWALRRVCIWGRGMGKVGAWDEGECGWQGGKRVWNEQEWWDGEGAPPAWWRRDSGRSGSRAAGCEGPGPGA